MTGVIVIAGVALFLAGVMLGGLAAAAVLVRRENRGYGPLTGIAPGRLASYGRRLSGLGRPDLDGELFPSHGDSRRY